MDEEPDQLSDFGEYSWFIQHFSSVYDLQQKPKISAYMEPDRLQKRYRMKRSSDFSFSEKIVSRSKRAIPHIIYPEILVIVDYDGYRLHGGDNTQVGIIFSRYIS